MNTGRIGSLHYRIRECLSFPAETAARRGVSVEAPAIVLVPQRSIVCRFASYPVRVVKGAVVMEPDGQTWFRVDEDVTDRARFATSDPDVLQVSSRGVVVAAGPGRATITASYADMQAVDEIEVRDSDDGFSCCASLRADVILAIDITRSMSTVIPGYGRRIDRAKHFARMIVAATNLRKNTLKLVTFEHGQTTLLSSEPVKTVLMDAIAGISGTKQKTSFDSLLQYALEHFAYLTTDPVQRESSMPVLVILSDFNTTVDTGGGINRRAVEMANTLREIGVNIVCLGTGATNKGAAFARTIATSGMFFNSTNQLVPIAEDYWKLVGVVAEENPSDVRKEDAALIKALSMLGSLCVGSCYGSMEQVFLPSASYGGFMNWWIAGGSARLLGNGLWDVMENSGLYAELLPRGTSFGELWSVQKFPLGTGGRYVFEASVAPNNRASRPTPATSESVRMGLMRLTNTIPDVQAPDVSISVDEGDPDDPENHAIPPETYRYVIAYYGDGGLGNPDAAGYTLPSAQPAEATVSRKLALVNINLPYRDDIPSWVQFLTVWKYSVKLGQWYRLRDIPIDDDYQPSGGGPPGMGDSTRDRDLYLLSHTAGSYVAQRPPPYQTIGEKTVLAAREITFRSGFGPWTSLSVEYVPDADYNDVIAFVEVTHNGDNSPVGPLIDSVKFYDFSGSTVLLRDTFDNENHVSIPTLCADDPNHPLCDGYGCWPANAVVGDDQFLDDALEPDEEGEPPPPPPQTYRATAQACVSAPFGWNG